MSFKRSKYLFGLIVALLMFGFILQATQAAGPQPPAPTSGKHIVKVGLTTVPPNKRPAGGASPNNVVWDDCGYTSVMWDDPTPNDGFATMEMSAASSLGDIIYVDYNWTLQRNGVSVDGQSGTDSSSAYVNGNAWVRNVGLYLPFYGGAGSFTGTLNPFEAYIAGGTTCYGLGPTETQNLS